MRDASAATRLPPALDPPGLHAPAHPLTRARQPVTALEQPSAERGHGERLPFAKGQVALRDAKRSTRLLADRVAGLAGQDIAHLLVW